MPIRAILFDMDGVIVDSEPTWNEVRVELATALGKRWTEEDQRRVMGSSTAEWAEVMLERLQLSMTAEELIDDIRRRMIAHYQRHLPLLPGAVEAVRLAASAYPVAVASGSITALIDHVLAASHLGEVLGAVVHGDTIARGKPEPDIYLEAARRLGVPPADCVGVEDSKNGLLALRAAGMRSVVVPSPSYPQPEEVLALADRHLASLREFSLEVIAGL